MSRSDAPNFQYIAPNSTCSNCCHYSDNRCKKYDILLDGLDGDISMYYICNDFAEK